MTKSACAVAWGYAKFRQPVSDELLAWARNTAMQASLRATLECLKSFSRTVPIASSARPTAQAISTSILLAYEGAPHGLFATHKDRLTRDLLGFLAR